MQVGLDAKATQLLDIRQYRDDQSHSPTGESRLTKAAFFCFVSGKAIAAVSVAFDLTERRFPKKITKL